MRTLALLTILAAASSVLSSQQGPLYPVQLSSRLNASSQADLDRQLRAPFPDGTAHPVNARNCMDMLGQGMGTAGSSTDRGDPNDYLDHFLDQRSTLVQCVILQELRQAAPSRSSFVAALKWDESILPLLPPQLAISISDESTRAALIAAASGKSWADVDKTATASMDGPDRVMVKGNGFIVRLILWGRGDLNRDGLQDLLVQTLDTLSEGTYRYSRLFILTRQSGNGKLLVVREL